MTYEGTIEGEQWEVRVGFRRSREIHSFGSGGLTVQVGNDVLVRTEKGVDLGHVLEISDRLSEEEVEQLMPLVRLANDADLEYAREQEEKEKRALQVCAQKIADHALPMKLVDAHLSFDNTRLVFSFSAEARVDFRELVRDLAKTFRKRIELRQIGVRDEAKLLGGIGPCGRRLCCELFLRNFEPVGIRIAKDQGLALNPSKISGLCDRLMCCLRYEHDMYQELRDKLPDKGDKVKTPHGEGEVVQVHLLKEELVVAVEEGREVRVPAAEVSPLDTDSEVGADRNEPEGHVEEPPDDSTRSKRRQRRRRRPRS